MAIVIPQEDWSRFFNKLSRDFEDWETSVQLLNADLGAQTFSEGLPFGGITFESRDPNGMIELSIGTDAETHQTHMISEPVIVAFDRDKDGVGSSLEVEDSAGTKTIVRFERPFPVPAEYSKSEIMSAG